ncbi:hypothetical protein [Streptomyces sp. NPDC015125]|uniref:hypothetical protein n=1 Tax=Streptomyces sp. NPDC015125 TaxID=3364938 RepID=UPI0036F8783D
MNRTLRRGFHRLRGTLGFAVSVNLALYGLTARTARAARAARTARSSSAGCRKPTRWALP